MELSSVTGWLRETMCGIQGHDEFTQYAKTRLYLKCMSCGHESAGWDLTGAPPKSRFKGVRKAGKISHLVMVPRRVA
jgi:hypothetical protein